MREKNWKLLGMSILIIVLILAPAMAVTYPIASNINIIYNANFTTAAGVTVPLPSYAVASAMCAEGYGTGSDASVYYRGLSYPSLIFWKDVDVPTDLNQYYASTPPENYFDNPYKFPSATLKAWTGIRCMKSGSYVGAVMAQKYLATSISPPIANFTGSPLYGVTPLVVNFTDLSTNSPTSWYWRIVLPDTSVLSSTSQNPSFSLGLPGLYNVTLNATSTNGVSSLTKTNYVQVVTPPTTGNITLNVAVRDAMTSNLIQNADVGIKNTTSNVWKNSTAATGLLAVTGTGTLGEYPLSVGENIGVAASATGYQSAYSASPIPFDQYTSDVYLTRNDQIAQNGNWNIVVKVIRNLDLQPITTGHIELTTGVSGPGVYTGYTGDDGSFAFMNISASTSAVISVVAQGYQNVNYVVTVVPNSTQHVTVEMVRIGETPVATPVTPAATSTYATVGPTPLPTICDDSGCRTVTTPDDNGLYALIEMAKMLPLWGQMIAGTVTLMLMWGFLYWALGGKYRKRKGWR
jgi:PKD repeat protein